ncbi:hypothetical protein Z947_3654 [Sulfitobacter geojensis]|nr:hypothetical protein Z947_3654 [Sulfitobacter geojensis]
MRRVLLLGKLVVGGLPCAGLYRKCTAGDAYSTGGNDAL